MVKTAEKNIQHFTYPTGVNIINGLFKSWADEKVEVDELLSAAQRKAGLKDFGDDFFIEPLTQLVQDATAHTDFHPLGAFLFKNKLIINLVNRLWARYWLKREEYAINKPLPPKVLITGLQRTGTTFLQRLLGALPEFRGVISWEIVNPVPKSKKKNYYGMYEAQLAHKALNFLSPEFKSIHSVKHNSLEEEVVLMDHAFVSTATQSVLNVPNYADWLEQQDQTRAYEDLKMWLQFLMWRKPAEKFLLLKSPHHMEYMDMFMSVFPDTKIIHTHRQPHRTLASYCSMVMAGKKIFSDHADSHEVGKYWLKKDVRFVDKFLEYRSRNEEKFYDVAYKDLVADPILAVQGIYAELGLEWTDEHVKLATQFYENHRKNKFGKHVYTIEDYGLSVEQVDHAFGDYIQQYKDQLTY
jgi:hypothetical protein